VTGSFAALKVITGAIADKRRPKMGSIRLAEYDRLISRSSANSDNCPMCSEGKFWMTEWGLCSHHGGENDVGSTTRHLCVSRLHAGMGEATH
jgi:hypothetical protein